MDTRQPAGDSASDAWPRLPNNQGELRSHCQRDRATWGCVHALGSVAPVTLRLIVTLHPHMHTHTLRLVKGKCYPRHALRALSCDLRLDIQVEVPLAHLTL